jgi:hypothetical protein
MPVLSGRQRMALDREMRRWHWISATVCLAAVLLFSVTGITLNRSSWIETTPRITRLEAQLPEPLRALLSQQPEAESVPESVALWIRTQLQVDTGSSQLERTGADIYLSMPRPGADAWLTIDASTGEVQYERVDRGWVAFFNDVHKGRHAGAAWRAFMDFVALACVVFSITGLVLLLITARRRTSTWPLLGGGVAAMLILLAFFLH